MSLLPPEAKQSLHNLLLDLISPNNDVRSHSEKVLNEQWIAGGNEKMSLLLVGLAEESLSSDVATVCF